ncbi:MAG TPA: UDP-N-acetylmuramoyl-tripeptide--D-alanyl-D-alanine ligase [Solirubrobacteraceae bacterium]|jgi:UDP-N-acetylmuramoyl-tripeptide--D-alanyl-D-alanine ligase|nr:UDP-N-acetylmuramoyl-tripeptide--D-alanyl-D-alanine ligase [Solirubrobacteraceae bacterium]
MRDWDARHLAAAAGATLVRAPLGALAPGVAAHPGPLRASVDTRTLAPGELFVGLAGENVDGGAHAARALEAGAWGVLVALEHAQAAVDATSAAAAGADGAVLSHPNPLAGLQALALAWRRELRARGAMVVAITGSTGKTSTKDILAALLGSRLRVAASPANLNTEIGLPLALLGAPADTELLVLEMAMRGRGQIAELTAIAEPEVGVIVNVGPAHLELLGSLEGIAAAKAELIAGLARGASVVVPAGEALLEPHLRADVPAITFGEGGDVRLAERRADGSVLICHGETEIELRPSFSQAHNLSNLLAAVAAARALGYTPRGRVEVLFSAMRGQRIELAGGVVLVADCYNANPMSMRAAIDDLAEAACARRVAVLGDMLELGPQGVRMHREVGAYARDRGVELLVTVGPLAAELREDFGGESYATPDAQAAGELVGGLLREGDVVLVKGSRGVGLERVIERLGGDSARGDAPPALADARPVLDALAERG